MTARCVRSRRACAVRRHRGVVAALTATPTLALNETVRLHSAKTVRSCLRAPAHCVLFSALAHPPRALLSSRACEEQRNVNAAQKRSFIQQRNDAVSSRCAHCHHALHQFSLTHTPARSRAGPRRLPPIASIPHRSLSRSLFPTTHRIFVDVPQRTMILSPRAWAGLLRQCGPAGTAAKVARSRPQRDVCARYAKKVRPYSSFSLPSSSRTPLSTVRSSFLPTITTIHIALPPPTSHSIIHTPPLTHAHHPPPHRPAPHPRVNTWTSRYPIFYFK